MFASNRTFTVAVDSLGKMSRDHSPKDSQSDSSNSSPNVYMLRGDKEGSDLILFGASATRHSRSATVRRASAGATRKDSIRSQDDLNITMPMPETRYRRSLDSTYRQSLESISEYKTKTFSSNSICMSSPGAPQHRGDRESILNSCLAAPNNSLDSTYSDCTDYATRSATESGNRDDHLKTFASGHSSSYLSWIESVNNGEFLVGQGAVTAAAAAGGTTGTLGGGSVSIGGGPPTGSTLLSELVDVDNKVGEWNNFWLNYNSPHNRYTMSTPYLYGSLNNNNNNNNEDKTGDDLSDCKSTCSTQREFNEKNNPEQFVLTLEELQEALHCSVRITDILQKALKRNDSDFVMDRSRQDSYYSQHTNSITEEILRERSFSYNLDPVELQRQRSYLKPAPSQPPPILTSSVSAHPLSTSTIYPPPPYHLLMQHQQAQSHKDSSQAQQTQTNSCINAILTTGVADILKRVINKRKEALSTGTSDREGAAGSAAARGTSTAAPSGRSSFSDWNSAK